MGVLIGYYQYVTMLKEISRKLQPENYEMCDHSMGVMCLLPPKRSENCDDRVDAPMPCVSTIPYFGSRFRALTVGLMNLRG